MIAGLPPHPMLITNLLAQIAFGLIAMTICLPSMQEWGALFGASQAQVQLTLSGFLVALGVFQLVYGPLSDRYGRKGVLVTGLALMALGSLLAALAQSLDVLITARVIQGAGSAAGTVVGGQLHVRFGWQANFILIMVLALLMGVAAWSGLPGPARARTAGLEEGHWLAGMLSAYAQPGPADAGLHAVCPGRAHGVAPPAVSGACATIVIQDFLQ